MILLSTRMEYAVTYEQKSGFLPTEQGYETHCVMSLKVEIPGFDFRSPNYDSSYTTSSRQLRCDIFH